MPELRIKLISFCLPYTVVPMLISIIFIYAQNTNFTACTDTHTMQRNINETKLVNGLVKKSHPFIMSQRSLFDVTFTFKFQIYCTHIHTHPKKKSTLSIVGIPGFHIPTHKNSHTVLSIFCFIPRSHHLFGLALPFLSTKIMTV